MMLVIGDKLALSFEQSNFTMSNIFTLLGSAILFLGLVKSLSKSPVTINLLKCSNPLLNDLLIE